VSTPKIYTPLHSVSAMTPSFEGGTNKMVERVCNCEASEERKGKVEKQLSALNSAVAALVGTYYGAKPTRKKRTMSAAGRRRVAVAQRARWKKIKAKKAVFQRNRRYTANQTYQND
jgi:hypothetical protein